MFIVNPKIKQEEKSKTLGRFVIEPLPYGYGITLGNSLRRVLLTSLKGAGITKIKIDGVKHEFSTIPGVKEDTVELVLNIKKIKVGLEKENGTMNLEAKTSGKIKAGDIKTPSGIKILNPDQHIATLADKKSKLKIEFWVEKGMGYVPAEEKEVSEIGVIPIDTIFAPVLRVNYEVAATRVGRMTNFDKLMLEVITDGSISPEEALKEGAAILKNYFHFIENPNIIKAEESKEKSEKDKKGTVDLNISLEELDLPTRVINSLHAINVTNLGELIQKTEKEISGIKNVGTKSIDEVKKKLAKLELSFKEDKERKKDEASKKRKKAK